MMKKFGFSKKSTDRGGEEDDGRSALFGSRSKKSSPAPASANPYAQPQGVSDPYAQDTNKYSNMGQPYSQRSRSYGQDAQSKGAYEGPDGNDRGGRGGVNNRGGYGAEKYGNGGGYGDDRYGTGSTRPGGYGGLGRTESYNTTTTEDNRDALFGGARERNQQKPSVPTMGQQGNYNQGSGYGVHSAYGEDSGGYGAYGEERQLTAEEQEAEDVEADKQQIRFMKKEDVGATRRALQMANQAEESGRSTLERLGAQGERIHNVEKNLDIAHNQNRIAEERAKEIKTLNRSMFAVHVKNPLNSAQRRQQRDEEVLAKHQVEREQRDNARQAAYGTRARTGEALGQLQPGDAGYKPPPKKNLAERAKYQFEADSEDDEMENEIDSNLDALSGAAGRLNLLARATGKEVDEQNKHIERIIQTVGRVAIMVLELQSAYK